MKYCPKCKKHNFVGVSWIDPRRVLIKCGECNFEGPKKDTLKEAKEAWDGMWRKKDETE